MMIEIVGRDGLKGAETTCQREVRDAHALATKVAEGEVVK